MEDILLFFVTFLLVSCIVVYFSFKSNKPPLLPPVCTISNKQWLDILCRTSMLRAISVGAEPHRAFQSLFVVEEGKFKIDANALNEVKTVSKLHKSQVDSKWAVFGFINGSIGSGTGGLNCSYEQTRQSETKLITCQHLIPKFELQLSPEHNPWMQLNEEFVNEANALANKGKKATDEDIRKFLTDWGEYFPTKLVIGGELYSEKHETCNSQCSEIELTGKAEATFLAKLGLGFGSGTYIGNKITNILDNSVISCKGGVPEQLGSPRKWLESLSEPTSWVPIELDNNCLVKILNLLPTDMNMQAEVLEQLIKDYKAKKPIPNSSQINLKLSETNLFLTTPKVIFFFRSYANVGPLPSPHIIELVATTDPNTHILNGAPVNLKVAVPTIKGRNHLYCDTPGNGYYYGFRDCTEEKWLVHIEGKGERAPLCDGDKVQFENMYYRNRYLYKYDGDNVGVGYNKPNTVWQVSMC